MEQNASSQYPRALIVEDDTLIALGLETQLLELGFEACDLAADEPQAVSHAIGNQPNVVLMDVNLQGNREGIEVARRLRERSSLLPAALITRLSNCFAQRCLAHRYCQSQSGATVWPRPWTRS